MGRVNQVDDDRVGLEEGQEDRQQLDCLILGGFKDKGKMAHV
jgi:hypothetical protein